MIKWFKQFFCKHEYQVRTYNEGFYDYEIWVECIKCGKQKEIGE